MALANLSNLYSGAAQVFNNAPHLQFQARLLMQHRAKQDALDSYYRKLPLMINEKGVRDQDRPDIAKGMNELKDFYIQNKDKIREGDQAAIYNYEKMIRNQQDLTGRSQSAGVTDLQVGKLKFNPAVNYMFGGKETVEQLAAHHLPVNDPNHVDFDLETFTAPPKPYDRTSYFKNFAQLKGNDNIQTIPNSDGTQTVINSPTYEEPHKKYVMEVAADKYLHDPSFTKMVDEDLGKADATNPLNEDFKQQFGHNIQTPIDLATAYTFNGLKPLPVTQKIRADQLAMTQQRQAEARRHQARQFAHSNELQRNAQGYRKAIIDYKAEKSVEENESVLNKFINTSYEAGNKKLNEGTVNRIDIGGTAYKGKFIDVPKSVLSEYAIYDAEKIGKDGKGTWEYPTRFYLTEDKKTIIPIFFGSKTSEGGNYIKPESKPIPIQLYKASLAKILLTKKDTGGEVTADELTDDEGNQQETPPKPTPSTKKITIKGL